MKQLTKLLIGMCLLLAGSQSALAVPVNFTASVLNTPVFPAPASCYSYLTHTVATSPTFAGNGEEHVGVMCFSAPTTASLTGTMTDGHVRDTAGLTYNALDCTTGTNSLTGTYGFAAVNRPYYGGGWVAFVAGPGGCRNEFDLTVNDVNAGLAGGFQFIKRNPIYNPAGLILGGTAIYQGAQPPAPGYYAAVLNGCYSFLSESVLSSPFPSGPGKDLHGLICFTPGGGATNPDGTLTYGRVRDLNGVITSLNNPSPPCTAAPCTGVYTVNDIPGWGMGTMSFGPLTCTPLTCLTFAFAPFGVGIPHVGVANGFQFVLIHPASLAGSKIEGGTAYFQQ